MSRIGRLPLSVPKGVEVTINGQDVTVKGPKGELKHTITEPITASFEDGVVTVARPDDKPENRSLHGLTRALIANLVEGVSKGYAKTLEIHGVGYRVQARGSNLEFSLGFSHPVVIEPPRASPSAWRSRRSSTSRASTSSWWARSPRTSVVCASLTRTRPRACGTRVSTSAARPERLVSRHGHHREP